APFHVHICLLDPQDPDTARFASGLYEELGAAGVECLMDDRDERPGVKFKDADLLGMPIRVNIGKRGVAANEVEIIDRKTKAVKKVALDSAAQDIRQAFSAKLANLSSF